MSGTPFSSKTMKWISEDKIKEYEAPSTCSIPIPNDEQPVPELKATGILHRVRSLLINQLYTDVEFVFGSRRNKQVLKAHKAILASGSPKFAEMLFGQGTTQQGQIVTEIPVTGVSFEIFKNIIEFLYTDEVYFDSNVLLTLQIFSCAKLYQVQPLMDRCNAYFESLELTIENAGMMCQLAIMNGCETLKSRCSDYIQEYTQEVISSSSFEKLPMNAVQSICKLQKLNLQSEVDLFEAVMRWGTAQGGKTKLRIIIEPLLKSIRFLAMTLDEFHVLERRYPDVLTKAETLSIVMFLAKPSSEFSNLPKWINKGTNRCFPCTNLSTSERGFEVRNHENLDKKMVIPLRVSQVSQLSAETFTCVLDMKCLRGRYEVRAVKFAFQDPVGQESVINSLILTLTVRPNGFAHTECLRIENSRDVYVPLGERVLVGAGNTLFITAKAEGVQRYRFLQFDESSTFSQNSCFQCTVGSFPKGNKLYFISEVHFEPRRLRPFRPTRFKR